MANTERKIGVNIYTLMKNAGTRRENFAKKLNYSYRGLCRILEGKMLLPLAELRKIST